MKEFIANNLKIIWIAGVILFNLLMIFVVRKGFGFLTKLSVEKNGKPRKVWGTLKRIFTIFLVLFGLGLLSYAFFEKETHEAINQNMFRILWIAFMLVVTVVGAALTDAFFENKIASASRRDTQDPMTYKFLNLLLTFGIYLFGVSLAAMAIPALKNLAASMLAGAGVLALVAGVAAQEGIANVIGGLFIVFFKPFRIGDVIKVGSGVVGTVEDINLRHTVLNDFQNKRVVIPNAIMNKELIVNYYLTEYKTCEWVEVGIAYDSDIDKAIQLMREEALKHPHLLDARTPLEKQNMMPQVDVQVISLGESSINLRAWIWAASYRTGFKMKNDLYKDIIERFRKEGIEIPFPHRTLVFKSREDAEIRTEN